MQIRWERERERLSEWEREREREREKVSIKKQWTSIREVRAGDTVSDDFNVSTTKS